MRLRIEKAVTDCLGLSHDGSGRAVLVRGALPGEIVECSIVDGKAGTLKAELQEVLDPSPMRRVPICPYYGLCGGCSFQIVSERDSASIKESIVRDNLVRIGKLSVLPPFEEPAFGDGKGYRHRARFHVSLRDRQWGFMARKSNEVIHIEGCPLLSGRLDGLLRDGRELIDAARKAMFENRARGGFAEVPAFAGDEGVSLGDEPVTITVDNIRYLVSASVFFQSNPRVLPELLSFVRDNTQGEVVMDLYSGVGTFSALFEGSGRKVYAVERDRRCLALSQRNAPSALSFTADVALWNRKSIVPDTVIVDPPRVGMSREALPLISSFGAGRIIYVSCDSATAARDISSLKEYAVTKARVFDFYPGSGHEESAFVLDRC